MKIALIHDWLRVNAGSEKVIKEIIDVFNKEEIELYTLFNTLSVIDKREIIQGKKIHTSMLQYLPSVEKLYRYLLPILPFFISRIKPKQADFYISSSHAVAKGFQSDPTKLHICYCHTPMRYAWFLHQDYLNDTSFFKRSVLRFTIPFIRKWDLKSATKVTHFIANSNHIASKIREIYQRDSVVIYPPVQVEKFKLNIHPRQDFYLALGRFVSHKKIDIVIKAFQNMPDKKLVLIGNGDDTKAIKTLLKDSPNIVWLGYQHDDELILYMQNAKACIFAAKEDFGIMCVEVQATGTPVLALNYGGYKETVIENKTGYFFEEQTPESISQCVAKFESHPIQNFQEISAHAQQFSTELFKSKLKEFTLEKLQEYK